VAESTLGLIVSTFKTLCELADFEATKPAEAVSAEEVEKTPGTPPKRRSSAETASSGVPVVNINIQLQLPATDDATVYDKLFAALKKHLLS